MVTLPLPLPLPYPTHNLYPTPTPHQGSHHGTMLICGGTLDGRRLGLGLEG